MNDAAAQPVAWADVPMVYVEIPTCPLCGVAGYKRVRTEKAGNGESMKKVICNGCGRPYKIVLELPETGSGGLVAMYVGDGD